MKILRFGFHPARPQYAGAPHPNGKEFPKTNLCIIYHTTYDVSFELFDPG